MVSWESQSKTTPQGPEDGHIYCILFIRIAFCHVSENLPLHCTLRTSISVFYVNTARDVVTGLLTYAKYLSFCLHIFTCTYRGTHTHKHTCTISTQEEWLQPGTGAWLRGAGKRRLLKSKTLQTSKKTSGKTDIHESKGKDLST